jgi:hypothetical protein
VKGLGPAARTAPRFDANEVAKLLDKRPAKVKTPRIDSNEVAKEIEDQKTKAAGRFLVENLESAMEQTRLDFKARTGCRSDDECAQLWERIRQKCLPLIDNLAVWSNCFYAEQAHR